MEKLMMDRWDDTSTGIVVAWVLGCFLWDSGCVLIISVWERGVSVIPGQDVHYWYLGIKYDEYSFTADERDG